MYRFALAGNANVGKSVIFNYLTGLNQHVGNWPGKTVELFSGKLHFRNAEIEIVDLPGIYSFSTFSIEEEVTREYIIKEKPDVVINVVDASALERNLYFTLQLLELTQNVVVALNQMDVAEKKGISIDVKKLSKMLGVPVVGTVATQGTGVFELVNEAINLAKRKKGGAHKIVYGHEIEKRIEKLTGFLTNYELPYPPRFMAIYLLEGDPKMKGVAEKIDKRIIEASAILRNEIYEIHHEDCASVLSAERYAICNQIAKNVVKEKPVTKKEYIKYIDIIATHRVYGYLFLILVMAGIFILVQLLQRQWERCLSTLEKFSLTHLVLVLLRKYSGTGLLLEA